MFVQIHLTKNGRGERPFAPTNIFCRLQRANFNRSVGHTYIKHRQIIKNILNFHLILACSLCETFLLFLTFKNIFYEKFRRVANLYSIYTP